jgi:hypothetical protein
VPPWQQYPFNIPPIRQAALEKLSHSGEGVDDMTQKTFLLTRWVLMFVSVVLSLTLVFFMEMHI